MKAYKGFNKDMTCRGFQYKEGGEYETNKAELCEAGFHACENPLDCLGYYEPGESVYHEVELGGEIDRRSDGDSNAAAMREALSAALEQVNKVYDILSRPCVVIEEALQGCREARGVLIPALAAPPRNCDRFNTGNPMKDAEDAYSAWQRYCDDPTIPPSCKVESAFKNWLLAPATEKKGEMK